MQELRPFKGAVVARRTCAAVAYVQVAVHHSIHHRGQLSMYLRPMGARVPSIYGESYDARQAREQVEAAQSTGVRALIGRLPAHLPTLRLFCSV